MRGFLVRLCPVLACVCLSGLLSSCSSGGSQYGDRPGPKGFSTVVIDAGHGGRDSGTTGRGAFDSEKNIALDLAQRLRAELQPSFKVVLTRDRDKFIELDERVRMANRHANGVLVSIHLNHGSRRTAGPETFWWRVDSYSLARRVQARLSAAAPYERGNRGLTRRRLRLTRNPRIPCVLVECGYLTNRSEAALFKSAAYRDKLVRAIAAAIREQSALGDAGMGSLPAPIYAPPSRSTDPRE